jgi:hypothetical protein
MTASFEFTQYITADGQVYNFDSGDRFLLSETGYGMPPIEYQTQAGPYQHGETVYDFRLRPRVIQLVLRANGENRMDYWNKRKRLIDILRPNRWRWTVLEPGRLRKVLPDGTRYDLDVMVEEGPAFAARSLDAWDEWGYTETVRFIAHDPVFYDPSHEVIHFSNPTPGAGIPTEIPTILADTNLDMRVSHTYVGSWPALPFMIYIYGPITAPEIRNLSTGEKLSFPSVSLPSGAWISIDLRYGQKEVTDSNGANRIGSLSSDSHLATWHIAPHPEVTGGVNDIWVHGSGIDMTTEVSIRYNPRYIAF